MPFSLFSWFFKPMSGSKQQQALSLQGVNVCTLLVPPSHTFEPDATQTFGGILKATPFPRFETLWTAETRVRFYWACARSATVAMACAQTQLLLTYSSQFLTAISAIRGARSSARAPANLLCQRLWDLDIILVRELEKCRRVFEIPQ